MVKCSAYKCNSASYHKTPGLSFHRFPKDNALKEIWVQNVNRKHWQPTASSVLCSKHFEPHVKDTSAFCTILRPGAIPTLFEESSENEENLPPTVSSRKRCAAGNLVLQDVQIYNTPEPQPCSSTHKDFCSDASKNNEEKSSIYESLRKSCAAGYIASVLQDVKNVLEPQPSSSSHSAITLQVDETKKIEDHRPSSSKENKLKRIITLKNKKIKALQQKTRRLKSKVCKLSDIISSLKKKICQDDVSILSSIPVNNNEFFKRFVKKEKGIALEKSYSPELRSFALQLHFYSPRAYNYVRNTFNTVLPHPGTLSRWYKNIDAEPGFTAESFETLEALSKNSDRKIYVNLSIDEMAIRKGLIWDGSENKYKGYVNTGTGVSDDSLPLATQALVIMVTAINFNWKFPIAYFFINSMTGEQRANVVKMAIEMLYKINVFVCGITFDGAASNVSMATHLGCNFTLNTSNFKPYFHFQNVRVNIYFDPCHMIKLIRNTLGDFKTLIDPDGDIIDFKYLHLLLDLQTDKGLHLANKLKQAHIMFAKQKMKVRLATQLLSKSVADALSFCRDDLGIEEFKHCAATVKFITIINDIFDVLNSRSTLAPGYKKALCAANIQKIKEDSKSWISYLSNLKLSNGNLVITSARKTGFIGFIIGLHSALNMYDDLICKENLRFFTVYKISQDFLEMFFGKMRAQGGFNDNPNVVQFKSAYKKNLIQLKLKLQGDGFTTPNSILTVTSSRKTIQTINTSTPTFEQNVMEVCDIEDVDCFINNIISTPLDDYTHHITIYIAGFVARKVVKVIKCSNCQLIVIGAKENLLGSLINKKDRGGLVYPSDGVIKVIQSCEKILKTFDNNINYNSLITYVADSINYNLLFKSGNEYHDANHIHLLIRVIVKFYIDIMCKYKAKQTNLSERNYLKKIILFKNK